MSHVTVQDTAAHCNTPQHTATHCNTPQHTATLCNTLLNRRANDIGPQTSLCNAQASLCLYQCVANKSLQHNAQTSLCNALRRTATHCNTQQHAYTHACTHARTRTRTHTPARCNRGHSRGQAPLFARALIASACAHVHVSPCVSMYACVGGIMRGEGRWVGLCAGVGESSVVVCVCVCVCVCECVCVCLYVGVCMHV